MKHDTKQAIRFFADTMAIMAFFLFVIHAPLIIQWAGQL